jgi:hypothetical protein
VALDILARSHDVHAKERVVIRERRFEPEM